MRTTIDKAGRVVIPAAIREKAGLTPGTPLEVSVEDFSVRLVKALPGPRLVRKGRRWVVVPTAPRDQRSKLDVANLIEEERDRWP